MKPREGIVAYQHKKFEENLYDYLSLLVTLAVIAGVLNFLIQLGKAFYLDVFLTVDIQYLRMVNYSIGRATSIAFFYVFSGIFFQMIIAVIASAFMKKQKLIHVLQLLFVASTPLLLFGWAIFLVPSLVLWSVFLFIGLARIRPFSRPIHRTSIEQRD